MVRRGLRPNGMLLADVARPIGCHETSVNIYKSMLCNTTENRRSRLHRGGSLKSRKQYVHVFESCANYPVPPKEALISTFV